MEWTRTKTLMWLLCSLVGEVIGIEAFPATAAGYRQLLEWSRRLGTVRCSADPNLREELAGLSNAELLRTCARLAEDSKNDEDCREFGQMPVTARTGTRVC
ncbi:hypothetical protein [Streptomyces triticisoli]|uniref:hypothetical protein n=1 Tax=Streptomyces triticisoli TaxID=2182797 RepID=UPI0018E4F05B|nr:hypothetical protein [Streptomyces triticisoli]